MPEKAEKPMMYPVHWGDKPYHSLDYELRQTFGEKVYRLSLNGGMTCPNRDGTVNTGGCIFCSGGSGYFTAAPEVPLEDQLAAEVARLRQKDPEARAAAYFQAHTNTYAPLPRLKDLYERALRCEGICGLSIGTRPDALKAETMDYLKELN